MNMYTSIYSLAIVHMQHELCLNNLYGSCYRFYVWSLAAKILDHNCQGLCKSNTIYSKDTLSELLSIQGLAIGQTTYMLF